MKRYVRSTSIVNYVDADTLHSAISYCKHMGNFSSYRLLDNMTIETTYTDKYPGVGPHGAIHNNNRFWKVTISDDNSLECYEISKSGEKLGEIFVLLENVR